MIKMKCIRNVLKKKNTHQFHKTYRGQYLQPRWDQIIKMLVSFSVLIWKSEESLNVLTAKLTKYSPQSIIVHMKYHLDYYKTMRK